MSIKTLNTMSAAAVGTMAQGPYFKKPCFIISLTSHAWATYASNGLSSFNITMQPTTERDHLRDSLKEMVKQVKKVNVPIYIQCQLGVARSVDLANILSKYLDIPLGYSYTVETETEDGKVVAVGFPVEVRENFGSMAWIDDLIRHIAPLDDEEVPA